MRDGSTRAISCAIEPPNEYPSTSTAPYPSESSSPIVTVPSSRIVSGRLGVDELPVPGASNAIV